jgi:hypothetical protein
MTLRRRTSLPFLLIAALCHYACDDNGETLTVNAVGPSPFRLGAGIVNVARGDLVQPAFIDPLAVTGGVCPTVPPLLAPFTVVFEGDGRADRVFNQVDAQFVDRSGVPAGSMVLTHTQLATRFGSTTIPASGTRAFPLSLPFGCVGAPTGVLTVVVLDVDGTGRETRRRTHVPIGRPGR